MNMDLLTNRIGLSIHHMALKEKGAIVVVRAVSTSTAHTVARIAGARRAPAPRRPRNPTRSTTARRTHLTNLFSLSILNIRSHILNIRNHIPNNIRRIHLSRRNNHRTSMAVLSRWALERLLMQVHHGGIPTLRKGKVNTVVPERQVLDQEHLQARRQGRVRRLVSAVRGAVHSRGHQRRLRLPRHGVPSPVRHSHSGRTRLINRRLVEPPHGVEHLGRQRKTAVILPLRPLHPTPHRR